MKRAIKITLISLATGGLLAGMVLMLVAQLNQPFFSPPDEPREWARRDYEKVFLSTTPSGGLPKLSTTAPLTINRSREEGLVILNTEGPQGGSINEMFEVFPADTADEVELPTGNRLRIEGIGMVMPEDIAAEKDSEGKMSDIVWLEPSTLEPLPAEVTKDWDSRRWVSGETPKLFVRVSNEGGGPVRWLAASAFDDRTLMQAQSGSSYFTHETDGQFGMDLEIWHQTPLRIAINFSFGEPELKNLELEPDAEVQFGDDALVRVIDVAPEPFNSTGRQSGGIGSLQKHTATFRFNAKPKSGRERGRGVVFHVWPAHNEKMIDFVIEEKNSKGKKRYLNAWGNGGITEAEFPEEAELVSVQVRRMPRLGRAVFLLPKIPRLPETDNLFNTPITRVEFHYDNHVADLIRKGAAVQFSGGAGNRIPNSHFPLILDDTTPAEVLQLNQTLAGRQLYFDRKKLEVSTERSGMLADLKNWWKRSKPRWLP